jgi:hypothetical protein
MAKITTKIDENIYFTTDCEGGSCTFFDIIKGLLIAISPLLVCGLIALYFTFC